MWLPMERNSSGWSQPMLKAPLPPIDTPVRPRMPGSGIVRYSASTSGTSSVMNMVRHGTVALSRYQSDSPWGMITMVSARSCSVMMPSITSSISRGSHSRLPPLMPWSR